MMEKRKTESKLQLVNWIKFRLRKCGYFSFVERLNDIHNRSLSFIIYKVLKFKEEPMDIVTKKFLFGLTLAFLCFLNIIGIGSSSGRWMKIKEQWPFVVSQLIFTVSFFVLLFLYLILKNRKNCMQFFLFCTSILLNSMIEYYIYCEEYTSFIFLAGMHYFLVLVPFVNLMLGGKYIFWTVVFGVIFISNFVVDCYNNHPASAFDHMLLDPMMRLQFLCQSYSTYLLTMFFMVYINIRSLRVQSQQLKDVEVITESVVKLKLNTPKIKTYMKKSNKSRIDNLLQTLIKNFSLYEAFLPESLKSMSPSSGSEGSNFSDSSNSLEVEDVEHAGTDSVLSMDTSEASSTSHRSRDSAGSINSSGSGGRYSGGRKSSGTPGSSSSASEEFVVDVQRRNAEMLDLMKGLFVEKRDNVTVLHIRMHQLAELAQPSTIGESYNKFIEMLRTRTRKLRGMIVNLFGGDVYVAWNTSRRILNAEHLAAQLACEVKGYVAMEKQQLFRVKMSISNHVALVGNMGSRHFKRFNVFGAPDLLTNISALTERNDVLNTTILFNLGPMEKMLKYKFVVRQVDATRKEDTFEVVSLMKKKAGGKNVEWMYEIAQLEVSEEASLAHLLEECWKKYKDGNFDDVIHELSAHVEDDKYARLLFEKCKSAKSNSH